MVERQQAFFSSRCGSSAAQNTENTVRYSDVFQQLITAGHSLHDLQTNYTQRQIELYFSSVGRLKRQHKADMIEAINMGFGGGENISQHVKQLRST